MNHRIAFLAKKKPIKILPPKLIPVSLNGKKPTTMLPPKLIQVSLGEEKPGHRCHIQLMLLQVNQILLVE
jgi:hypothetical protein